MRLAAECEEDRFVFCDNDRVFELGSDGAVRRAQRPAIAFLDHAAHTGGEERLDGEDQPLAEAAVIGKL